jgi:hypothetical protein
LPEQEGLLLRFRDERGGLVVLSPRGDRLVHRGTLGAEAGLIRAGGWPREWGLTPEESAALSFVLRWSGAPFDAVGVSPVTGAVTWGICRFTGTELIRVLATFERRASDTFLDLLGRFGVHVAETSEMIELRVQPLGNRRGARGARALQWLAEDPRWVAVLARVGRNPEAGKAQLQAIGVRLVGPLRAALRKRSSPEGAKAPLPLTARVWAALYGLAWACGARVASQLGLPLLAAQEAQDDESRLTALARQLEGLGREVEAAQVLRTLSSPELEP